MNRIVYNMLILMILSAFIVFFHDFAVCYGQNTLNSRPAQIISNVENIRFWSNPRYTRIVIDLDKETTFSYDSDIKDSLGNSQDCININIQNSRLSEDIAQKIHINNDIVSNVFLKQTSINSVAVTIHVTGWKTYKIFSLTNPYRVVVDAWGKNSANAQSIADQPNNTAILSEQLSLGVNLICIDAGFGGRDTGARCDGLFAKDINLQIAKKIAARIKSELSLNVVMTRKEDKYISLEERSAIANTSGADLFISIHTNGSKESSVSGIETFLLNLTTDNEAIRVASRENSTNQKDIAGMESILTELMKNAKVYESELLAKNVQKKLYIQLSKINKKAKNRGVKQAPFYILLSADMPSIMVQTGFLTNPIECKLLSSDEYQNHISTGIVGGIKAYIMEKQHTTKKFSGPKGRAAD